MDQDLMEWITAEKEIGGTGLLLVPTSPDEQKNFSLAPGLEEFILSVNKENDENKELESKIEFKEIQIESHEAQSKNNLEFESEAKIDFNLKPEENLSEVEAKNELESDINEKIDDKELEEFSNKISELDHSLQEIENFFDVNSNLDSQENSSENENEDYENEDSSEDSRENFSSLDINLNEPPPELWTRINPEDSDLENNEDEELDYEQGMSLQGAAYVPKVPKDSPGRLQNFTERLHQSLRGRKRKAEQLREQEEKKSQHSYRSKAFIICIALLVTLGLAYLALYFVQRWTPEKIYERAQTRLEIGDYEHAMNLFNDGYKRYPENLNFLKGFAKAAESSGMTRTAIAAWEDYINLLPENENENKNLATLELKRIKGENKSVQQKEIVKEIKEIKEKREKNFSAFSSESYNKESMDDATLKED